MPISINMSFDDMCAYVMYRNTTPNPLSALEWFRKYRSESVQIDKTAPPASPAPEPARANKPMTSNVS
jgi:hypothetical protein